MDAGPGIWNLEAALGGHETVSNVGRWSRPHATEFWTKDPRDKQPSKALFWEQPAQTEEGSGQVGPGDVGSGPRALLWAVL